MGEKWQKIQEGGISMSTTSYVKITPDELMAYVYIAIPKNGEIYTRDDIMDLLNRNGVRAGIIEDAMNEIVENKAYGREIKIAKGVAPVDGIDGKYEFMFDILPTGKPRIREDGTVDYRTISAVQSIQKGQLLATYVPAVPGTSGMSVKGTELRGKVAKNLQPLKGKGFERSEDGLNYIATMDGKASYTSNGNKLTVSDILEIREDLNFINGELEFRGDIIIHGSVQSGCKINAKGSVTIDGNVEAAFITADKDIILRNGMQGGGEGKVQTKGNIFAKFMENCIVNAAGDITADVFVNCKVNAGGFVEMSGKRGLILGGSVHAIKGINAITIGNDAEIKTMIKVGTDQTVYERIAYLKEEIKKYNDVINQLSEELAEFEKLKGVGPKFQQENTRIRITGHLRNKIKFSAQVAELAAELQELVEMVEVSKPAKVTVDKYLYPGSTIKINTATKIIESKYMSVCFHSDRGEIITNDIFYKGD